MNLEAFARRSLSRRTALKVGAARVVASQAVLLEQLAWVPNRLAPAGPTTPSDIQFDIGAFVHFLIPPRRHRAFPLVELL